jgi:hypothetical protein
MSLSPSDIYLSVITKLTKNLGTDNITVDKARVVSAFNENQIRRVSLILERKIDDSLREIQKLLVKNEEISLTSTDKEKAIFKLPINYFEISSVYALGDKDKCKGKTLFLWEIKDPNYNEVLSNEHLKPSFNYQEIPYIVGNDEITAFQDSTFNIKKAFLTYYKYPKNLDIAGYIKTDNTVSTDVPVELDDRFTNKVIAMTVEDFQRNFQDQLGHSLSKDRVTSNN